MTSAARISLGQLQQLLLLPGVVWPVVSRPSVSVECCVELAVQTPPAAAMPDSHRPHRAWRQCQSVCPAWPSPVLPTCTTVDAATGTGMLTACPVNSSRSTASKLVDDPSLASVWTSAKTLGAKNTVDSRVCCSEVPPRRSGGGGEVQPRYDLTSVS